MKQVQSRMYTVGDPIVEGIRETVEGQRLILNFGFDNRLEQVCIYRRNLLHDEEIDWQQPYCNYTREEYCQFGGFVQNHNEVGLYEYVICPLIQEGDEEYIIRYEVPINHITVPVGKIQVKYSLKEKKKLFSNRKTVQMSVFCEAPLPSEYLCYMKKKGSVPVSSEDGIRFEFIADFEAGENRLPEIEVDKDEYIRIYLSENVKYKALYHIYKI